MLGESQRGTLASLLSGLDTTAPRELELYGRLCILLHARGIDIEGHDLAHLVHLVQSFATEWLR